ncbi:MAG: hypothetical protein L0Z53_09055 [Acidobacteriales bacterium]|nr:hypothetical protein [Terriglobales bacterium]
MSKPRSSRAEKKQVMADATYWGAVEKILPWRLHGFSGRHRATFLTAATRFIGDPLYDALVPPRSSPQNFIQLTAAQRDQLVSSLGGKQ